MGKTLPDAVAVNLAKRFAPISEHTLAVLARLCGALRCEGTITAYLMSGFVDNHLAISPKMKRTLELEIALLTNPEDAIPIRG
jgi:hypothetical protein